MTHRLATNYAKNYCNRTPIVKVIAENVVMFFGDTVYLYNSQHWDWGQTEILCDVCVKKSSKE